MQNGHKCLAAQMYICMENTITAVDSSCMLHLIFTYVELTIGLFSEINLFIIAHVNV